MDFNDYSLVLKSYLDRLNLSQSTKSCYLSQFKKLEKAHRSKGCCSPKSEIIDRYISIALLHMRETGLSSSRIHRVEFVLNAIRLVFEGCSFNDFNCMLRKRNQRSFILNANPALRQTIDSFTSVLYSQDIENETAYGYSRAVLLFLNVANVQTVDDLRALTPMKVTKALSEIMDKESPTFASKLCAIRSFLTWLKQSGYIETDLVVATNIRTPRRRPLIRYFNQEELNKLLAGLDDSSNELIMIKAIIVLTLYTGLRSVDLSRLQVTDLNWNERSLSIVQSKTKVRVSLPLTDTTAMPLAKYLLEARPKEALHYVFCDLETAKALSRRRLSTLFSNYRDSILGEGYKGYGLHALRRTLGSRLFQSECDTTLIKEILGHTSIRSLDSYIGADDKHLLDCNLELIGTISRKELTHG